MKQTYAQPKLVEYGRLEQLTLGSGGTKPDFVISGTQVNTVNNNCDASAPATACLVAS